MKKTISWKFKTILFFISQCITLFGSQIVQMAIVWYVTLATQSGIWIAAFSVCSYLPQFFVSFVGGAWADRFNKKALIIGADLLIATVTLTMFVLMPHITADTTLLWALLTMSVIRSVGAGIQNPAVNATIPYMVPEEFLLKYNGINATMQSVVQFAAPAAAAAVLTTSSLGFTLLIDIMTAAVGVSVLLCLALPTQKSDRSASVADQIGKGVKYALSDKLVKSTLTVYAWFIFFTVPAGYLSGLLVSRIYGDTYWYLTAVELVGFGGMMLGGLFVSFWTDAGNHKVLLSASLAMFGIMAVAMGATDIFVLYLIFMGLYGVALTMVQTTITTILQKQVNTALQGRVFGLMNSLYSSCYPIGMVIFGAMADRAPLQGIMVFSGAALLASAIFVRCSRSFDMK